MASGSKLAVASAIGGNFAVEWADLIVESLGDEIETSIRSEFPRARYLDIEAD